MWAGPPFRAGVTVARTLIPSSSDTWTGRDESSSTRSMCCWTSGAKRDGGGVGLTKSREPLLTLLQGVVTSSGQARHHNSDPKPPEIYHEGSLGGLQASSILKDQVHLAFLGMGDLDFDKAGLGNGPGFSGFRDRHSRKMKAILAPRQTTLGALSPTLTILKQEW